MPRIPQEEIERIKREISVQSLAEARGIVLKPHGKSLIGLCQFHPDKSPSLVITPETNLWNCLGACRQGGDVFKWVMKSEGVSFRHAYEILRAGSSITSISRGKSEGRPEGAKRPTAGDEPREFTSRGEGGRVPPFFEKLRAPLLPDNPSL